MFSRASVVARSALRQQSRSASTESAQAKAQAVASNAAQTAQKAVSNVTGVVGNALGAYKEPVFYNAAVAKEIAKQVYLREKLSPPSLSQVSYTYQTFFNNVKDVSFWQNLYKSGEWKRVAVYAVEAYGVFKIGEMIGRRHVVGYKLDESKAEPAAAH